MNAFTDLWHSLIRFCHFDNLVMNEKRSLIKTIWDRKKNWIGHVIRGDGLMKLVIEGRIEGMRLRGRPRMRMINDVLGETYRDMKRKAEKRVSWRIWKP